MCEFSVFLPNIEATSAKICSLLDVFQIGQMSADAMLLHLHDATFKAGVVHFSLMFELPNPQLLAVNVNIVKLTALLKH